MASRKRKKSSYSQQIAGVVTMGMPSPIQKVASSKVGSKLFVLLIPILIASGIITISFSGGLPSVSFNQQRAAAVSGEVKAEALKAAERVRQYNGSSYR
jgi:hypothetical protein